MFCGYVTAATKLQHGKRKKSDLPSLPPPAKSSFRSTECLLLSLLRQGSCDETESPMSEVLGGKLQSRLNALNGGEAGEGDSELGGSCTSFSTVVSTRPQTRSCSLEIILDDSAPLTRQQLFLSSDSLASCSHSNKSQDDGPAAAAQESLSDFTPVFKTNPVTIENAPGATVRNRRSVIAMTGLPAAQRLHSLRPRSIGSCLDIVMETREEDVKEITWQDRAASCLNVSTLASQQYSSSASHSPSVSSYHPSSSSHQLYSSYFSSAASKVQGSNAATGPTSSTSNLWTFPAPAVVRRCLSSLDVSKPSRPVSLLVPPVCVPARNFQLPQSKPEHSKTLYLSACFVDVQSN